MRTILSNKQEKNLQTKIQHTVNVVSATIYIIIRLPLGRDLVCLHEKYRNDGEGDDDWQDDTG